MPTPIPFAAWEPDKSDRENPAAEAKGCIKGAWQTTESGREAKYYTITRAGHRALKDHVERWRIFSGLVEKLFSGSS